jgi:hypothetical protein
VTLKYERHNTRSFSHAVGRPERGRDMDRKEIIENIIAWGSWAFIAFAMFIIGG